MLTYQFLFFLSFLCVMNDFLSPLLREYFTSRYHFNNCFYLRFVTTDYWRTKPSKLRICLQGFYLGPCNTFHQLHIHFSTKENRPLNIALTTRDKTIFFGILLSAYPGSASSPVRTTLTSFVHPGKQFIREDFPSSSQDLN